MGTFTKKMHALAGKLQSVAPEYRFGLYKQLQAKKIEKQKKGSPVLRGSFENGKKR